MDITLKDGKSTACVITEFFDIYHRENKDYPGITITVHDSRGDKIYLYLTHKQSSELCNKLINRN